MRIWIDADAAPRDIKEIVFRAARRLKVQTTLVANQSIAVPPNAPTVDCITVRDGANVADRYIVEHASAEDMVITADIPLAAELVAKDVAVIDPRGEIYDADNIASRLSMRDFFDELRGSGETLGGSKPFSELDKKAFASAFDRTLTRLLRDSD